jgi:hypothetical protein
MTQTSNEIVDINVRDPFLVIAVETETASIHSRMIRFALNLRLVCCRLLGRCTRCVLLQIVSVNGTRSLSLVGRGLSVRLSEWL